MELLSKQVCFLIHYSCFQFIGNESTALLKTICMLNTGNIPINVTVRLRFCCMQSKSNREEFEKLYWFIAHFYRFWRTAWENKAVTIAGRSDFIFKNLNPCRHKLSMTSTNWWSTNDSLRNRMSKCKLPRQIKNNLKQSDANLPNSAV